MVGQTTAVEPGAVCVRTGMGASCSAVLPAWWTAHDQRSEGCGWSVRATWGEPASIWDRWGIRTDVTGALDEGVNPCVLATLARMLATPTTLSSASARCSRPRRQGEVVDSKAGHVPAEPCRPRRKHRAPPVFFFCGPDVANRFDKAFYLETVGPCSCTAASIRVGASGDGKPREARSRNSASIRSRCAGRSRLESVTPRSSRAKVRFGTASAYE